MMRVRCEPFHPFSQLIPVQPLVQLRLQRPFALGAFPVKAQHSQLIGC